MDRALCLAGAVARNPLIDGVTNVFDYWCTQAFPQQARGVGSARNKADGIIAMIMLFAVVNMHMI